MKTFYLVVLGSLLPLCLGCGSPQPDGPALHPVTGVVTLDGTPVKDATVEFIPVKVETEGNLGGSGANGVTNESGEFEMKTGRFPGVQAGEYKVRIEKVESVLVDKATDTYQEKNSIPEKYTGNDPELSAKIEEKSNTINFELKSN